MRPEANEGKRKVNWGGCMRTPAVRLVPAPPLEPPFDDQRAPEVCLLPPDAGAQLVLKWRRPEVVRAEAPRGESPAGAAAGVSAAAWHAVARFVDRCLEILNGYRPASHIRALSTPAEAQTIMEEVAAAARRITRLRRTSQPGGRPGARPDSVARRRVRVSEPRPGAAEATAVLSQASRSWAVAFRLERRGGAWLCTAFTDVTRRP
jgi:Family of unknown function (DUF6459)